MKISVMFFLSFLLLVFVSMSVSSNNAFAKSGTADNPVATTPPTFTVVAFSSSANVSVTPAPAAGDEYAADLGVLFAGLKAGDVHSVAPNTVHDMAGEGYQN